MEHATIDITFKELIRITTALSYTYNDIKGVVPYADEYEQIRLSIHKQFPENRQQDE